MEKTILITGATGAIGKATTIELAKNNCNIIMLGRDEEKLSNLKTEIQQFTVNNKIEYVVTDLSEPASVKQSIEEVKGKHKVLNGIIHIAAIFKKNRTVNSRGQEYMFVTNHLSNFILTNGLLDLLRVGSPSRVISVSAPSTSKINFDDIHGIKKYASGFLGTFGATKMMNLVLTYALANRVEGSGVTANAFFPGLVKSELTKEMSKLLYYFFKAISKNPDKAAKMLVKLAIDKEYQNFNGAFFNVNGKQISSNSYSHNIEVQEQLWALSEKESA